MVSPHSETCALITVKFQSKHFQNQGIVNEVEIEYNLRLARML